MERLSYVSYNDYCNIDSKSTYNYVAPGAAVSGTPTVVNYAYNDTIWRDLLTSIGSTTITYDNIGNPNKWRNGYSLTWQGRNLNALSKDTIYYINCKYNSAGIRTHKDYTDLDIMYTTNYDYVLDGSKIIKETISGGENTTLYYFYDESGVTGFNYNGSDYYYGKNLQGDITKIYDWFGNEVTSYTYDAWGKIISVTGSLSSTVGQANPFRYRSYYYDTETGWYYLNSRYYDPSVGRFINADGIIGANGGLVGYNMFAYCNNNPVNHSDPSGHWYVPANPDDNTIPPGEDDDGDGIPDDFEDDDGDGTQNWLDSDSYQVKGGSSGSSGSFNWNGGSNNKYSSSVTVTDANPNDKNIDYYVTPKGDAIPTSKSEFNKSLSTFENKNGKFVNNNGSNGPVRVRIEDAHTSNPGFTGANPYHEVPHIHVEYRKNGMTGPWGEPEIKNNFTFPQDWFRFFWE